jgi:endo-1,4-beta-xylanase
MHFPSLLTLALTGCAIAAPLVEKRIIHAPHLRGLNGLMKANGKQYFGTATSLPSDDQSDSPYKRIVSNTSDIGQLTAENAMKWADIHPLQDQWDFDAADALMAYADMNEQSVRCHTLVWYNSIPDWVTEGGFDNATLIEVLQDHITREVTRFKGRCLHWDVVNEGIPSSLSTVLLGTTAHLV